jgi:hypothetical protein
MRRARKRVGYRHGYELLVCGMGHSRSLGYEPPVRFQAGIVIVRRPTIQESADSTKRVGGR